VAIEGYLKFEHVIFASFEIVRPAKIYILTARGSTSGGTRSFLRNNYAQTLIESRKFEECILNIERSKIPRSLTLP
jgi:hypothetical protein